MIYELRRDISAICTAFVVCRCFNSTAGSFFSLYYLLVITSDIVVVNYFSASDNCRQLSCQSPLYDFLKLPDGR